MAFGLKRAELNQWKRSVKRNEIAFLTHYWLDARFPECDTVTKVGCADLDKLAAWGERYGLKKEWIDHNRDYPHFDLFGQTQQTILKQEGYEDQLARFK